MSLCRMFGDSDLYVYVTEADEEGATDWMCCFPSNSVDEMVKHIQEHINSGDRVPDNVIPDIKSRSIG